VRERLAFRLSVLRVFPYGGRLLLPTVVLQVRGGVMPVAFIVATSAIFGRVPAAVEDLPQGLETRLGSTSSSSATRSRRALSPA
jgi:hypothetical protein